MSKPDTSADELRKKFERYHRGCDKYEVLRGIYPNDRRLTEKPCSCGLDKLITTYTEQRELALLERLEEQKIYGHLAVPDCTHFVPLSAIQKEKEKL